MKGCWIKNFISLWCINLFKFIYFSWVLKSFVFQLFNPFLLNCLIYWHTFVCLLHVVLLVCIKCLAVPSLYFFNFTYLIKKATFSTNFFFCFFSNLLFSTLTIIICFLTFKMNLAYIYFARCRYFILSLSSLLIWEYKAPHFSVSTVLALFHKFWYSITLVSFSWNCGFYYMSFWHISYTQLWYLLNICRLCGYF